VKPLTNALQSGKAASQNQMTIEEAVGEELIRLKLLPLTEEQVQCLHDRDRIEEASGMLADLRDQCGVRFPLPTGTPLGGPYAEESDACQEARQRRVDFEVVAVDRMATDDSRNTGVGDEYYVTGFTGPNAVLALAMEDEWVACWLNGNERGPQV
jgi:hypothetical protein